MEEKNILVLMSTYNGEKYLRQQIDSILNQKDINISLLVRDDGSIDGTLLILDEYKAKGLLEYYQGENLKPARSFMHLLQNAPASDYYAFADQDDVWLPEKLSVAINCLKAHESVPALYFCQTQLVDENLNKKESVIINPYLTFEESLIYQFIGGCTMVMNNNVRKAICEYTPLYILMHDIWVYSVVMALGGYVIFDKTPHILYRQHTHNAVGQGSIATEIKRSLKRFSNNSQIRYKIAKQLKDGYYDRMPQSNKDAVDLFLQAHGGIVNKMKLIGNKKMRCASRKTNVLFWINVLFNRV